MLHDAKRCDVVVIGARVAGAATALLLAREGLHVLVLDRSRRGADTLSTHALVRGGVALLNRWGLLDRLVAAGTPAIRQMRFYYGGASSTVSIRPAAGVDALYAPRRTLLNTVLIDAAVSAGAEVRFGVTVVDLCRDADGRVTGVLGRDRAGASLAVQAWLTVGADGARSAVARCVGARTHRIGAASGAVVYGYWSGLEAAGYEWFYRPRRTVGLIPTNDGEVCVFAGVPSQRFADEFGGDVRAGYLRQLDEVTCGADGRLAAAVAPSRVRSFPAGRATGDRTGARAGALVGNAGNFLDPLSTHGMIDALRDAHRLARAARAVRHGEPDATAFATCYARRDLISGPIFETVDQICAYRWDMPGIRRLLLELNSAMSDEVEAVLKPDA